MEVASKIKKERELKGYSQEHMSEKLGITQAAYSKMESSGDNLDFEKIQGIADILGIEAMDLLNLNEQYIFNNCDNSTILGNNTTYNAYSEKEMELYKSKIKQLEEEVAFYKRLLSKHL